MAGRIDDAQNIWYELGQVQRVALTFRDDRTVVLESVGIGHQGRAGLDVLEVGDHLFGLEGLLDFVPGLRVEHVH